MVDLSEQVAEIKKRYVICDNYLLGVAIPTHMFRNLIRMFYIVVFEVLYF